MKLQYVFLKNRFLVLINHEQFIVPVIKDFDKIQHVTQYYVLSALLTCHYLNYHIGYLYESIIHNNLSFIFNKCQIMLHNVNVICTENREAKL